MIRKVNYINKILKNDTEACQDPDNVLKTLIIYALTFIGTIFVIAFGIRAFLSGDILLGAIETGFTLFSITNLLYYRYSNDYNIASKIIQILLALLLIILTFNEKLPHSGILLWYHTFPLLVIFLSGKKEGIVWACSILCISVGILTYKANIYPKITYSNLFSIRFIFSYIACTVLAYTFEYAREESYKRYRIQNNRLNQSQELIRESQINFQMILSSMRDVIFTVDLNGIIVKYFVPHLQSNLISVPEDYIGNDFRSMLPDHIAVQLEDAIKKIERGEESSEFEYFTGTENYKKWFYAKVSKIINNENIGQGYLVLARDITNRKEEEEKRIILEGKLMRSEQSASLGRIAAGMAHEINNPASTVMSDLQIVKKMLNKLTSYRS